MTQVRYFGFVKAEEPWTGNQFKMYAGKNGSTFGSKVPAGSVVGCSGQFFTTRVRLFRRRGCWYAYHFVSVDM